MNSINKRLALATVVCLFTASAFATQPGNNGGGNGGCGVGQQTNGCGTSSGGNATGGSASANAGAIGVGVGIGGAGGNSTAYGGSGGKGGEGGSAAVIGSGNSSVKNDNTNVGVNTQGQKQGQEQSQRAEGGNATSLGGQGSGNSTEINVAAPVIPKPAANSAYVGDLPQLPQGSCRLFIGGGGTTRDGSATGMIPIGNDQTCLSTRALEVMKQINATVGQQVFGHADMLYVACQIEGMDKLAACKK